MRRPPAQSGLLIAVLLVLPAGGLFAQEAPGAGSSGSLLDVPFLPQTELLCGGAAAAMVLRYWGATGVRPEAFRPLVRPAEGGIRGGDLAADVRGRGWRAVSFRGTGAEVRHHLSRGRPVVALLEVAPGRLHYVVVVGWTEREVIFHDPARAPFERLPPEEFTEAWRATDRWTLLMLPSGEAGPRDRSATSGNGDGDGDGARSDSTRAAPPARSAAGSCRPSIRRAVALAGEGEPARAEALLRETIARCPDSGRARTELAGLHARRGEWDLARRLARAAVSRAPADSLGWKLLATGRYLGDEPVAALAAWNRVGQPRIERVRLRGLDGTRFGVVQRRMDLAVDELLTPRALMRASRRLSLLPSAADTRIDYRPLPDGRAEVTGHLLQRPRIPASPEAWVGIGLQGALSRGVRVPVASPTGGGELWTAEGRWEANRPRVSLALEVPGVPHLPGVVSLEGGWERQSYRQGSPIAVEERRLARLRTTDWVSARVRWGVGAGVDKWSDGPTDVSLSGELELRSLSDLFDVGLEGRLGTAVSGGPGRTWGAGALGARWRSSTRRQGPVLHLRARAGVAGKDAPLAFWPGAGEGRARPGLLRAHPLLDDGVIVGEAFGQLLLDGGLEGRWWIRPLPGLSLAPAAFLDAARPWRTPDSDPGRLLVDVGVGARAGIAGRGAVRVDLAKPLGGGPWRLQAGWEGPWPGW